MTDISINEVTLSRAVELFQKGEHDQAQAAFLSVLQSDPNDLDSLYFMSMIDFQAGRIEVAENRAADLVRLKPKDAKALNLLGSIQMSRGNLDEAEATFAKGIRHNGTNAMLKVNAAFCQIGKGEPGAAVELCRQALKADDKYANAYNVMGSAYLALNDHQSAADSFRKALELNPAFLDAQFNLGKALLALGDEAGAQECFDAALAQAPENINVLTGKADVLLAQRKFTQAAELYDRALKANPKFGPANRGMGRTFLSLNDANEAMGYFRAALEANPDDTETLVLIGEAFRKLKNFEAAAAAYRDLLSIDAENFQAKFFLAGIEGTEAPAQADQQYVADLFDEYSESFDESLRQLEYKAPHALLEAAEAHLDTVAKGTLNVIDLGCGTGLAGEEFKQWAGHLKGIDLSPRMIDVAQRRGVYDELEVNDVLHSLVRHHGDTDVVVSADVFPYVGDLESIFLAVTSALKENGLFVFTVEKNEGEENYRLSPSARYKHSSQYLADLARRRGLEVLGREDGVYRMDAGEPVHGMLLTMRKRAAAV